MIKNLAISFLPVLVNLIAVFIGWLVLYGNAKKLNSRAETYSIILKADDILSDLDVISREFWTKAAPDNSIEARNESEVFNYKIAGCVASLVHCRDALDAHTKLQDALLKVHQLRAAATLDSESKRGSNRAQATRYSSKVSSARMGLLQSFREIYPIS